MNTLIIGASPKPHRFAFKALQALQAHQHSVILFAPRGGMIDSTKVHTSLSDIQEPIDTVTLYVNPAILEGLLDQVTALKPRRVIFNPGTESEQIQSKLTQKQIHCIEDCTLIMLREGRY